MEEEKKYEDQAKQQEEGITENQETTLSFYANILNCP